MRHERKKISRAERGKFLSDELCKGKNEIDAPIDPLGQPKVTTGRDNCFRTCCPYVRPHFSNLEKQNNRKQCSLLACDYESGRVDH